MHWNWLPAPVRRFFFGDETTPDQLRKPILAYLATKQVSSPQLMASDLKHPISVIDSACVLLVKEGKIRRSERQIDRAIEVDEDGPHIPSPYVRYELIVVTGDMLAALGQIGPATVAELAKALGATTGHVEHMVHEALDHGWISVAHDRPDAYALPRR